MRTTLSFKKLKNHPWNIALETGFFLFPTEALYKLSNPDASDCTDMGDGSGILHASSDVFDNILDEGMRDPFYILISYNRDKESIIRLESGNHRVKEALDRGITHLPVLSFVQSYELYSPGNGLHKFPFDKNLLTAYYKTLGRNEKYYDPYPHPVDIKKLLKDLDILYSASINIIKEENGLIYF